MSGEDTNRYPTDPLNGPAAMAETLRSLEQRVSALEGAPLVGVSAQALDATGAPLVTVGTLPDGDRGLEVRSEDTGWTLVKMTTEGWKAPHVIGSRYDPVAIKNVTSATFVDTWGIIFGDTLGPGIEVLVPWATDIGTTGEVRVTHSGGQTVAHAVAAASNGFAYVRWLHGFTVGTGPFALAVQARRTAGAGNVVIFQCHAWVTDPAVCSSAGNWL